MDKSSIPLVGCQWYAAQMGWQLLKGNVMVEGNLDVRYFRRAAALYHRDCGLHLLDKDLSVFAAGTGDAGGTYGITENFPALFKLARLDLDANGKVKYRTIALLDSDHRGKSATRLICQSNRSIRENANVFLLRRNMPRKSRDAAPLSKHLEESNREFNGLDCVVEDLLDAFICELYEAEYPQHIDGKIAFSASGHHRRWTQDGKFGLCKYMEQYAELGHVTLIVEVLKSLRFYLGLPEDGVP